MKLTAEELDVCRNLKDSVAKCMKSKRTLRILGTLQTKGIIEFDPFGGKIELTDAGRSALTSG